LIPNKSRMQNPPKCSVQLEVVSASGFYLVSKLPCCFEG
jgi:hypothetical protein